MEIDKGETRMILEWVSAIYDFSRRNPAKVVFDDFELDFIERLTEYIEYEIVDVETKKMGKLKKIYYILRGWDIPEEFE